MSEKIKETLGKIDKLHSVSKQAGEAMKRLEEVYKETNKQLDAFTESIQNELERIRQDLAVDATQIIVKNDNDKPLEFGEQCVNYLDDRSCKLDSKDNRNEPRHECEDCGLFKKKSCETCEYWEKTGERVGNCQIAADFENQEMGINDGSGCETYEQKG